jgi:hypothetical protein
VAYEIAVSRDPSLLESLPNIATAHDACSLCRDVFSDGDVARRLIHALEDEQMDRVLDMLHSPDKVSKSSEFRAAIQDLISRSLS